MADESNLDGGALNRNCAVGQGLFSQKPSELAKEYRALKKEYLSHQRSKALSVLAANKGALEAYLESRRAAAGAAAPIPRSLPIPKIGDAQLDEAPPAGPMAPPSSALPSGVMRLPMSDRRVSVKMTGSSQPIRCLVRQIPAVQPPPCYTTWSYLKRNELARDHGRRMFLVDDVGETVPADDGETEERLPWEEVDGGAVDWAMSRLAHKYGWDNPDVLEGLLEALRPRPQPEAIAQRLAVLQRRSLSDQDRRNMEVEEVIDVFAGAFCRRCRVYGCRTHGGGHVKPHHRPAPPPPDTSDQPCGPGCWKLASRAAAAVPTPGQGARTDAAGGSGSSGGGEDDAMEVDGGAAAGSSERQQQELPSRAGNGTADEAGPSGGGSGVAAAGGGDDHEWSMYDVSLVEKGIEVFGRGNPCMVALLLGGTHSCAEVKRQMDRSAAGEINGGGAAGGETAAEEREAAAAGTQAGGWACSGGLGGGEGGGGGIDLSRVPARRKGGRGGKKAGPASKSARSLVVSARAQNGTNDWHEYVPCTCAGKCKADCPCVQARNFCEKFCACSTSCKERFRGCNCKSGCKTNACPCWAAGRECDPDLCGGCAPTLEARAEPGRECHNMRLRMRQHAHVVLGTSDIPGAGWGLFAAQYVAKNGFLGEYTGDLITQDEANRRGSVYDHMNNSYLFNLNNEWVVDAKFRGNKLRCANHSHEPVAKAKVLLVDGESRIAILADKNVTPGMEITYDYRYSDDTAPQWVKKKQQRG